MTARQYIAELAESIRCGDVAVFCGAGISINSGLPPAFGIIGDGKSIAGLANELLQHLGLTGEEVQIIREARLPFELIIEVLTEESDITPVLEIFLKGEPNANHQFLAKLAAMKRLSTVCTTNFDLLLENAFAEEGLLPGTDYRRIARSEHYDNVDWKLPIISLIKLHGSADEPKDMAITISKVANGNTDVNKQNVLRYLFSEGPHKRLLIVGYSCSDVFDINPHIALVTSGQKEICFVEHSSDTNIDRLPSDSMKPIGAMWEGNPFAGYPGVRLSVNTDAFIQRLWAACLKEPYTPIRPIYSAEAWKHNVIQWAASASEANDMEIKCHLAATLFWRAGQFALTIKYWKRAYRIAHSRGDLLVSASHLGNLGLAYRDMGYHRLAIRYMERALRQTRRLNSKRVERRQLSNLGATYRILGDSHKALQFHKAALTIARELKLMSGIASSLGNLGICYDACKQFRAAIWHYKHGLRIARASGDKRGEAIRLGNLADTYNKTGRHALSLKLQNEALVLKQNLGDILGAGISYYCRGLVYENMGDLQSAVEDFQRAMDVLIRVVGDEHVSTREAFAALDRVRGVLSS